jgi:hypothetical protein
MTRTHFRFHWPATPGAEASARRTVELLPLSMNRDRFDDLRLLLSEAVLSVVHGSETGPSDEVELGVSVAEHDLRAEVTLAGTSPTFPPELSGWGMLVVDKLSSGWGVLHGPSSGIWFELPFGFRRTRPPSSSSRAAA